MQLIVGEKIKARRKELRMTQKQLCKETGISQPYLSRVERDIFMPSVKQLYLIAATLQVKIDDLIETKADQ